MTDDEIDKLHDSIDCWSGYGLGARFDHRAFARKVEAAERERCARICEERMTYWQRDDARRYEDKCCAAAIRKA